MSSNAAYLQTLSKDQLVQRILHLQAQLPNQKQSRRQKSPRPMDWSKYGARRIALKFCYFGWDYYGLTSASQEDLVETIESHLYRALIETRLIPDRDKTDWSRCGRTDKGVSSFGQVAAFTVRSNVKHDSPLNVPWPDLPISSKSRLQGMTMKQPEPEPAEFKELPYLSMINRLLPSNIRAVAWSPVHENFDARFSCIWRKYQYYFPRGNFDIEAMQRAASLFVGSHDFRNFAKIGLGYYNNRQQASSVIIHTYNLRIKNFTRNWIQFTS